MAAKIPSEDLRAELTGRTLGGVLFTEGTNLFTGDEESGDNIPDQAIFLYDDGGLPPVPRMGTSKDDHEVLTEVIVRGKRNDEKGTRAIVAAVRQRLHALDVAGYTFVLATNSLGSRLLPDGENRPRWQITFRAAYDESRTA